MHLRLAFWLHPRFLPTGGFSWPPSADGPGVVGLMPDAKCSAIHNLSLTLGFIIVFCFLVVF